MAARDHAPSTDAATSVRSAPSLPPHTPGPWRVEGRRGAGYIISAGINAERDGPETYVGVIDPMFHISGERIDEHAANARLIAAAPELLEALDWLLASVETDRSAERYPGDKEERLLLARGAARATIAKAVQP